MKSDLSPACRKYIKQVSRRLEMPKKQIKRVCSDLSTSIQVQLEEGIPEKQILKDLGTPRKVAAEFNEQMGQPGVRRSPLRFLFLGAAIFSALVLLGKLALSLYIQNFSDVHSIGIIGGADGPTSVFVSTTISANGFSTDTTFWIGILILGVMGYFWFRRRKQKKEDH